MSDTGPDTRPAWMLDPSLTDIDEDAIAAVGKELDTQNEHVMDMPFINRGSDLPTGQDGQLPASASTPPQGAPNGESAPPATAQESAPVSGGGDAPIPDRIVLNMPDGTQAELNRDQVFALMQNYEWMRTRPEATLQAWGGIESGTHQAVMSTEYAEFTRWKATQGLTQRIGQRPADLDDLDPDVAEYVRRLEAQATSNLQDAPPAAYSPGHTPAQAPQVQQQGVSALDLAAQQRALVDRQVRVMGAKNEVAAEMMTRYNLTSDQVAQLESAVAEAQIIPGISMKYAVKNAMGQVIQEADPRAVFSDAFEATMATHPVFRSIRDEAIYNQRLQQDRQLDRTVAGKKAAAGSLAHTPSAAVSASGNGKSINEMTPQERQAAMVAELTQLMASGQSIE